MAVKDVRNTWGMSDPTPHLQPTLNQVFPKGWQPADAPCQIVVGNWLDGTTTAFMDKFNVRVIVKASGSTRVQPKPPYYAPRMHRRSPADVFQFPMNPREFSGGSGSRCA